MKKIVSLGLAGLMLVSACPMVYAADVDYSQGTNVVYDASQIDADGDGQPDNVEAYTVTVPALLAPGGAGDVTASGTWASDRQLVVDAADDVVLTNSINSADTKTLVVTFDGITLAGDNTQGVSATEEVSVADIENALFGTWSGTFTYNVEMQDVPAAG